MRISKPEIVSANDGLRYRVQVDAAGTEKNLWFSIPSEFGELISDSSDAALAALLIPAMSRGEDLHIAGVLSEKLFYNLSCSYQALLRTVIPSLSKISICPEEIRPATPGAPGVATGFSGGVDSFCVLADHHCRDAPPGYRLTHLLFNNVGSHGHGPDGERLFQERYDRLGRAAARFGLPFIAVNSNVEDFYRDLRFRQTHTSRNAAVALLLQRGIGKFMYASTYGYADLIAGNTGEMAAADPVALPLLSTERMCALSSGSEYNRVQKTLKVGALPDSYESLDVCATGSQEKNCSVCMKCLRTLLTLELAGLLGRYEGVFDLEAYEANKPRYIEEVLQSEDPFCREITSFANKLGVSLRSLTGEKHRPKSSASAKGVLNRFRELLQQQGQ
jgi:hypothetical protein